MRVYLAPTTPAHLAVDSTSNDVDLNDGHASKPAVNDARHTQDPPLHVRTPKFGVRPGEPAKPQHRVGVFEQGSLWRRTTIRHEVVVLRIFRVIKLVPMTIAAGVPVFSTACASIFELDVDVVCWIACGSFPRNSTCGPRDGRLCVQARRR